MSYDCIIVGGGMAGLQAAIQLGRYQHHVLVIDSNQGRSNLCRCYHNILGWPEGVSGQKLRDIGKNQAVKLGVEFTEATVVEAGKQGDQFVLTVQESGEIYMGKTLLLATGVLDRIPLIEGLQSCLGMSVYICPDCDGYEVLGKRTVVLGSGNPGANMALTLTYWTDELIYINHEQQEIDEKVMDQLKEKGIQYYNEPVHQVLTEGPNFQGVFLESGAVIGAGHAFTAFGGNKVRSDLAKQLGVKCHHNKHIFIDSRTKRTNVDNVWAAGDVTAHSEQLVIALGDGLQAAIWIHKSLM